MTRVRRSYGHSARTLLPPVVSMSRLGLLSTCPLEYTRDIIYIRLSIYGKIKALLIPGPCISCSLTELVSLKPSLLFISPLFLIGWEILLRGAGTWLLSLSLLQTSAVSIRLTNFLFELVVTYFKAEQNGKCWLNFPRPFVIFSFSQSLYPSIQHFTETLAIFRLCTIRCMPPTFLRWE